MRRNRLYPDQNRIERLVRSLKRMRRRVRVLNLIALVALAVEVGVLALTSPRLAVESLEVTGAGGVSGWALQQMESARGRNLFLARARYIGEEINSHPEVRRAEISRRLPDKLIATVELRQPYACAKWKNRHFLLDSELVPFRQVASAQKGLPLLEIDPSGRPELGKTWQSSYLEAAVRALEAARDRDLRIAKISIDPGGDMCLNIVNGISIRAGSPQDIERKVWVASNILLSRAVRPEDIQYLDVSSPGAPAYRPKDGQVVSAVQ